MLLLELHSSLPDLSSKAIGPRTRHSQRTRHVDHPRLKNIEAMLQRPIYNVVSRLTAFECYNVNRGHIQRSDTPVLSRSVLSLELDAA